MYYRIFIGQVEIITSEVLRSSPLGLVNR